MQDPQILSNIIIAKVNEYHNPSLNLDCKSGSHVLQIWNDGELTSTKGGELFGLRTLHLIYPGGKFAVDPKLFPVQNSRGWGYAFVTSEQAIEIRKLFGFKD